MNYSWDPVHHLTICRDSASALAIAIILAAAKCAITVSITIIANCSQSNYAEEMIAVYSQAVSNLYLAYSENDQGSTYQGCSSLCIESEQKCEKQKSYVGLINFKQSD